MSKAKPWIPVMYASDATDCPYCEEPFCEQHSLHYADCPCPGPGEEDKYIYKEVDGYLYARLK